MNKLNKYIIFLLVILSLQLQMGFVLGEKAVDISSSISTMMEQARRNEAVNWISDAQLKGADPQTVLSKLALYEKDDLPRIRQLALRYCVRLAHQTSEPEVRQEVTERLVSNLADPNLHLSPHPYEWLLTFKAEDFSSSTKELIRQNFLRNTNIRQSRFALIVGVANITEELPRLERLLIDELAYQTVADKTGDKKWYYTLGWYARLARARMGIQSDTDKCIELVRAEGDITEKVLRLLPNIGYIRQPEAIECLREYLNSDERLQRVNPNVPGEPVASYIINILADCLDEFPIEKRERRGYTVEEINLCRQWMAAQTMWRIIR